MAYGDQSDDEMSRVIPECCCRIADTWLRDTQVIVGRDAYYMTGTSRPENTAPRNNTVISDALRIWKSTNLRDWQALGPVWRLDEGPDWLRNYHVHGLAGKQTMTPEEYARATVPAGHPIRRALWAPKLLYSRKRDNYYVAGCVNFNMGVPPDRWVGDTFGGTFLLESVSGQAEGPYRATTELPMTHYIDPYLFEDDDGALHIVWQDGNLARLNDRLDGLVRVNRPWQRAFDIEPTKEGACLFKHDGRYHLGFSISAHFRDGRHTLRHHGHGSSEVPCGYQFVVASAAAIHGPYGERYTSIVNGGHGCPFQDRDGQWWACVFHPPGTPEQHFSSRGGLNESLGPRLVTMQWQAGQIVPDPQRTRQFYAGR